MLKRKSHFNCGGGCVRFLLFSLSLRVLTCVSSTFYVIANVCLRVYGHCILWNGGFLLGRAIACVNVGHLLRLLLFCFFCFCCGSALPELNRSIAVGGANGLLGFESKNGKRPPASAASLPWPAGTANKNCYEDADDDNPDGRTPNDGGSAADAPPSPPPMTAAPIPNCSSSASLVADQITASTRSCWGCS